MVDDAITSDPLAHLDYFSEWGGRSWQRLLAYAFDSFIGSHLENQCVLDIGTRYGKMASLFAMLGARVVGIDINQDCLASASREAEKWAVSRRTCFVAYDGNLDVLADQSFDLVFTKSVLVTVPRLADFLRQIDAKLKPGGRIVFLENGRGNAVVRALRRVRHRHWDFRRVTYFTPKEVNMISEIFRLQAVRRTELPPVYLILGTRRQGSSS